MSSKAAIRFTGPSQCVPVAAPGDLSTWRNVHELLECPIVAMQVGGVNVYPIRYEGRRRQRREDMRRRAQRKELSPCSASGNRDYQTLVCGEASTASSRRLFL